MKQHYFFFSYFKNTLEQIKHTQNVLLTRTFSLTSLITTLWKLLWSVGTPMFGLCVGMPWAERPPAQAAEHPAPEFPRGQESRQSIVLIRWSWSLSCNPSIGAIAKCCWRRANLCFYPSQFRETVFVAQ